MNQVGVKKLKRKIKILQMILQQDIFMSLDH